MPAQSTRTLTQRRAATTNSVLESSPASTPPPPIVPAATNLTGVQSPSREEGGTSIMKIVIWGIVILLIAAAVYFLINNVLSRNTENTTPTVTPTPTEVESEEPDVINASKLDSSLAEDAPGDEDFKTTDQSVGTESADEYVIQSFVTRSYDRFFRMEFEVSSSGDTDFPLTKARYNADGNSIELEFRNIVADNSGMDFEVPQRVQGSVVTSITRRATSDPDIARYTIGISEDVGYFLHTLDEPNRIVVDVKEAEAVTPTPEPTLGSGSGSSEKPSAPHFTNDFSKQRQYIVTTLSANTVTTPKYAYRDFGTYVKITYDLSGGIPNVDAQLNGTELVITMQNRVSSNKSATVEINNGNVTTMDVVSSGSTTTYTVHLVKEADYRIYAVESPAQFIIEVKD